MNLDLVFSPIGASLFDSAPFGVGEAREVADGVENDYGDVPPVKGMYAGSASEGLGVSVEITQL